MVVIAVVVCITPVGTSDPASYAAYGRIAALGHNPYVYLPINLPGGAHNPYTTLGIAASSSTMLLQSWRLGFTLKPILLSALSDSQWLG